MFEPSDETLELEDAPVIDRDKEKKVDLEGKQKGKKGSKKKGGKKEEGYLNIDDVNFDEEDKWHRPAPEMKPPEPKVYPPPTGKELIRPEGRSMPCPKCKRFIQIPESDGPVVLECSYCGAKGKVRY